MDREARFRKEHGVTHRLPDMALPSMAVRMGTVRVGGGKEDQRADRQADRRWKRSALSRRQSQWFILQNESIRPDVL
jgi:hypothetical protein